MDLLILGYRGDVTRVSCLQMGRELSGRTYPEIGVPEAHHGVSHHQRDPHNIRQKTKIDAYNMSLFVRMLETMRDTPEGDGSLLDHSLILESTPSRSSRKAPTAARPRTLRWFR